MVRSSRTFERQPYHETYRGTRQCRRPLPLARPRTIHLSRVSLSRTAFRWRRHVRLDPQPAQYYAWARCAPLSRSFDGESEQRRRVGRSFRVAAARAGWRIAGRLRPIAGSLCRAARMTIRLRWDNVNALAVVTIPPFEVCAKAVSFPTHSKSGLEASRRRVVVECASRRRSLLSGSNALDGRKS